MIAESRAFWAFISTLILGAAAQAAPLTFTYQGVLTNSADVAITTSQAVIFSIYSPGGCLLYQESRSVTPDSNGAFTEQIGSDIASANRTGSDPGLKMSKVFEGRAGQLILGSSGTCSGGYTTSANDVRYLRINVGGTDLSPDVTINAVPFAMTAENAETLNGLTTAGLLQVNTTSAQLSQANAENVFSSTNFPKLTALLAGSSSQYLQSAANGTVQVPDVAGTPSSPNAGQLWYDSGVYKFWDGSSVQSLGVAGAGITSLGVGAGLTPQGTITSAGTTIAVDTGTGAGQIVQVQAGGKLPALDGSNLTNLNGSAVQSGMIGGSTMVSTSGTIATSSSLSGNSLILKDHSGAGPGTLSMQAPNALSSSYTLTWPTAPTGTAGYVLSSDTAGNLSWINPTTGSLTAVSNQASLANGKIWVGDGSNKAQELAVSGDVTLSNAGAAKVVAVQNTTVSSTAPSASGQVLRFNGSSWAPSFVGMLDLRSTITGSQALAGSCSSNQTLTYNSLADNLTCSDISLPVSQIAGVVPLTSGGTGTTDGSITGSGALTFTAGGSNQNVTLVPSGSGSTILKGSVGIGTTAPSYLLTLSETQTANSGALATQAIFQNVLPSSSSAAQYSASSITTQTGGAQNLSGPVFAQINQAIHAAPSTASSMYGTEGLVTNTSTGIVSGAYGTYGKVNNTGSGTITNGYGVLGMVAGTGGAYSNATGVMGSISVSAATVSAASGGSFQVAAPLSTSSFGVKVSNVTGGVNVFGIYTGSMSGSAGSTWSIYASDATAPSYFAGKIGIGTNTPSESLTVAGGNAAIGGNVAAGGQISSGSQTITGGTNAIDWNNGNQIATDYNCASAITFANMRDGGTYTLAVTDTTTAQCSFATATTGIGAGTVTYFFNPTNGTRASGAQTIYTFMRIGSRVYVSWSTGFH